MSRAPRAANGRTPASPGRTCRRGPNDRCEMCTEPPRWSRSVIRHVKVVTKVRNHHAPHRNRPPRAGKRPCTSAESSVSQQRLTANDVESAIEHRFDRFTHLNALRPKRPYSHFLIARSSGRHAHPTDVARSGHAPTGTGNICTWPRPRLGSPLAWRTMAGVATTNAGVSGRGTRAVHHNRG